MGHVTCGAFQTLEQNTARVAILQPLTTAGKTASNKYQNSEAPDPQPEPARHRNLKSFNHSSPMREISTKSVDT